MAAETITHNPINSLELYKLITGLAVLEAVKAAPELTKYVGEVTMISHGTEISYLLGHEAQQGIIYPDLTKDTYRLAGQKELNTKGIASKGNTTGIEAFEDGEEGVSFEAGNLTGYGQVYWIMPLSCALEQGGTLSSYTSPIEQSSDNPIGGMHGINGEVDVYSPFATVLAKLGRFNAFVEKARDKKLNHIYDYRDLIEFEVLREDENAESIILDKEILERRVGEFDEKLQHLLVLSKDYWGVSLYNPFVMLMVPEKLRTQILDQLSSIKDEELRKFISNQIIFYHADLDEDDDIDELLILYDSLKKPEIYVEKILPNLKIWLNNPDLTSEDAENLLKDQETLLRFGRVVKETGPGYVFPPSLSI